MSHAEATTKLTEEIMKVLIKYVTELDIEVQTQLKIQRNVEEVLQDYC